MANFLDWMAERIFPERNFPKDKNGKLEYLENYPQTSQMLKDLEDRYELIGKLLED